MAEVQFTSPKGPGRSDRQGISIPEFFALFPTDKAARKWFEATRWRDGRWCPKCGGLDTVKVKGKKPMPYRCRDCRGYFSVRLGTTMQSSKLPYRIWLLTIYLLTTNLKGVSSLKLHRDLAIHQHTAWVLAHKIRQGWEVANEGMFDRGEFEVDETFIGGKERNKHADKKTWKRGTYGKEVVAGVRCRRTGQVRARHVGNTRKGTLQGIVREFVPPGSIVYTDEHRSYMGLRGGYRHGVVTHGQHEYVDGKIHTNGIESHWAGPKRSYKGTYHFWSAKHLHRYITEHVGRHNWRGLDTIEQMAAIWRGMEGRRLTWDDLHH